MLILIDHDGVRLITNDVCDYLQKVPEVTEEVFRFGTESPASILLDAVEQLEQQSPKADDNIQLIRPHLVEAVDTCVSWLSRWEYSRSHVRQVKAAGHEFSIHWQKQLLKAASFGKSVLDIYNSDEFVDMCETLRVLNAVRYYEIGLPVSYDQYLRLTPEKLVRRLINRHEYLLALKISSYLRLPTDQIYVHWASQKVRISTEDETTISRLIVHKLAGKRGISFEQIARSAYDEGRGRLATELLNHEPRAGKQVPLLLSMEEDEIALDKAIESGDSDLVFYVLLQLKRKLPLSSFFRVINTRPVATSLIESTAHSEDASLLKDLYYQDDRRLDGSNVFIREALLQPDTRTTIDKLNLASKLLSDAKETSTQRTYLSEAVSLLKVQDNLQREMNTPFVGLSLNATISKLIQLNHGPRAKKLSTDFKIAEKTYHHLLLRSLIASRNWAAIEDLVSKNKKSPVGWKAWFEAVVAAGNLKLAGNVLVQKCVAEGRLESGEAMRMWEACGLRVRAAEEAVRNGDRAGWERLRDETAGNTQERREIERVGVGLKK